MSMEKEIGAEEKTEGVNASVEEKKERREAEKQLSATSFPDFTKPKAAKFCLTAKTLSRAVRLREIFHLIATDLKNGVPKIPSSTVLP